MSEIVNFFGVVLKYIYGIVPNLGLSIIILTVAVKIITFPLNNKQIQSAKRMQILQPEIKKIQDKYKNDKERQNKEVMTFMQANNINPMAGCLPLLIQFPVLIGIYRLLIDVDLLGKLIPGLNEYLIPGLTSWGNLLATDPFYIFPILSGITTFIYQKLTITDPSQKMMLYMMPAVITYISFKFPVGLVLYWTMNNLFSMGQHYLVVYAEAMKKEAALPEKGK